MKCERAGGDRCFGIGAERECLILAETDFNRQCPFFKPAKTDYSAAFAFEGCEGVWKFVKGYDGKYLVSNLGEVMSSRRHKLEVHYAESGKPFVRLYENNSVKATRTYIAPLVSDAFVPGTGLGKVYHIDGDLANCAACNLKRVL